MIITSDPVSPIRPVGSDATLTCTVELSPAVDVPVTVNVQLSDPAGSPLTITSSLMSGFTYISIAIISSFGRDQSGNYTCTAIVSSSFLFFTNSRPQSVAAYITVGKKHIVNNKILFLCS